ncbi:WxL protein host-binding domain-containing protein [Enterococcus hirae]|uniref:WxL protein host-binding domain-containing protein n=1 Tax=Enterococcus hirae TaxID=1354 RepID=UPI00163DBCEC
MHPIHPIHFNLIGIKKDLEPGKYLFTGEVKTKEKTWKLEKEFEITESKAKTINKEICF